jgi:hypothetical protein
MNRTFLVALIGFTFLAAIGASPLPADEFSVEKNEKGVTVKLDGQLFTEYLISNGPKPILWPIIGPTGVAMTRAYPMQQIEGEKHDHPHHRSLWLTHGNVNGIDFWAEKPATTPKLKEGQKAPIYGTILHREFRQVAASGNSATIATVNDWLAPDGQKQLEDERVVTFSTAGDSRIIDFDVVLKATAGDVKFGDTKEGSMGIRVPTVMDVTSKQGGQIVNSEGQIDKAAWGQRARWVDYHGPVGGQVIGIAFMNHPTSFRYPTTWHVRDYGLFAANPFGLHDFAPSAGGDGSHTIPSGQSMTLRYRFIFHKGDEKAADIESAFSKYAAEKK